MAQVYLSALAAVLCVFSSVDHSAAETIKWKTVGDWSIDAYVYDDGNIHSCLASGSYEGGDALLVGLQFDQGQSHLVIWLANDNWRSIESGKEYEVTIQFGNESPWTVTMDGLTNANGFRGLSFVRPWDEITNAWLWDFRRKLSMRVHFGANLIGHYTLRGTNAAVVEVLNCYERLVIGGRNEDPFGSDGRNASGDDPFEL